MRVLHKLEMGRFYVAADGYIWCCYKVYSEAADHCRAWCIRLMEGEKDQVEKTGRWKA